MHVQGAGGNASLKDGKTMWIKASGTLLADAMDKEIMVPVDLEAINTALSSNDPKSDTPAEFLLPGASTLRPSIETSLHAVFPHTFVLHTHCIHTLAHAVLENSETVLAERLQDFDWALVPYAKPGAHLAIQVRNVLGPKTNVVILRNHGLIVAGNSFDEVHDLQLRVHEALRIEADTPKSFDQEGLSALILGSNYELPEYQISHQLALDPKRVEQITRGSLYPDHVIFCGIAVTEKRPDETLLETEQRVVGTGAPAPAMVIIPRKGIVVRKDNSAGATAMIRCLADVMIRVRPEAKLQYLTTEQNFELLNWDAEKYRQTLNV